MRKQLTLITMFLLFIVQFAPAQTLDGFDKPDYRAMHDMLRELKTSHLEKTTNLAGVRGEVPSVGEDYDVSFYRLNLKVDDIAETLDGNVIMTASALSDGFSLVALDFYNDLSVDSVKSGGQSIPFTQQSEVLEINLPDTLSAGESFLVNTFYHGTPASYGWGTIGFDQHETGPIIWTLSEPFGARSWWPCKDIPSDKADSADVWLTVDSDLVATAEGTLRDVIDNGDGTTTYKWHEQYPITTYLISMAISNYVSFADWYYPDSGDSMEVRYWVFPEDSSAAEIDFSETVPMIEAFVDAFMIEYPFLEEKYAMSAFPWGGAMEHQTNTSYGSYLIQGNHHFDTIVAHELAHMWWGDMVTCYDFINIWLNEGFATYSEAIWVESYSGATGLRDYMLDIDHSQGFPGSIYDPDDTFNSTVYEKGGWALHMLRHVVGDSIFFETMRQYGTNTSYFYANATTEDFQNVCEDVSGRDLDWFFTEWIYGENRPNYEYWWVKEEDQGNWDVHLHIDQVQTNAPPFMMPIDIELVTASGETTVVVWDSLPAQDFHVILSEEPNTLHFDSDAWVLKWARQIPPVAIDGEEPGDSPVPMVFSLSQNHPNPFNPRTTITYTVGATRNDENPLPVHLHIFDARGRLVQKLIDTKQKPGTYQAVWDGRDSGGTQVTSGVYFYRLEAGDYKATRKMVLTK